MRRRLLFLVPVFAAALAVTACQDESPTAVNKPAPQASMNGVVPGEYIVVFRNDVADPPGLARQLVASHGGQLRFTYQYALKGFAAALPDAAVTALQRNPQVAYVEPDQVMYALGTQTPATWGLDRIDQHNLPLNNTYSYNTTAANVTAYIIDTGILISHTEFAGRASVGFDAYGGTGIDCNGHGTHVAGTVGGETYGVAKDVGLVAVRVLDCGGSGTTTGVIAGIDWVTKNHETPAVANMSLGGGVSTALDDAVKNSIAAGISYAVAAGNSSRDACFFSPARVPAAMTIGATTSTDAKASYSNYGTCVDWFAPGSGITSAWYTSTTATNTISGTSMATPHTTGVAALYLEANAGASPAQVRDALFAATTKGIVTSSRTTNNHLLYSLFGATDPPVNSPPVAGFSYTCDNLSCVFHDTSTDAGSIVKWDWAFGDGTTSTLQNPTHNYGAAATYSVTLTVTDDGGASSDISKPVTVTSSSDGINLTASIRTAGANIFVDLTWSGATSTNVAVYRNSLLLTTTANDGAYSDKVTKVAPPVTYKVCEAGTTVCSSGVSVDW